MTRNTNKEQDMGTKTTRINLATAVDERAALAASVKELTETLKHLDALIIQAMDAEGLTKAEGAEHSVTLVRQTSRQINEEVLATLLTPTQWKRVTKAVVDRTRLEAEITVGRIDADAISPAISIVEKAPYLRGA